ncbi:hypothetical protein GCM10010399_71340 [Dactylosporangium fulvum]|uniref:MarR family transcriptional regulator n=1 Tax=Dactylosporangium fulvum TaxID=53359 RepID=A0ABY5VNT6_9ACTN|nr:MarR family transcriptional regulator [Dactylosporangium fulvum]UWP79398.1 MarR family transcriptional regulator [Dactylosporangium fulvum]
MDHLALAGRLSEQLNAVRRVLRRRLRVDLDRLPLTGSQLELLRIVESTPGIGVTAAAQSLHLAGNSVSTLVNQLTEADLLRREQDPADRRTARLFLTDTATARLSSWRAARLQLLSSVLTRLSPTDRAALEAALPALANLTDLLSETEEPSGEAAGPPSSGGAALRTGRATGSAGAAPSPDAGTAVSRSGVVPAPDVGVVGSRPGAAPLPDAMAVSPRPGVTPSPGAGAGGVPSGPAAGAEAPAPSAPSPGAGSSPGAGAGVVSSGPAAGAEMPAPSTSKSVPAAAEGLHARLAPSSGPPGAAASRPPSDPSHPSFLGRGRGGGGGHRVDEDRRRSAPADGREQAKGDHR